MIVCRGASLITAEDRLGILILASTTIKPLTEGAGKYFADRAGTLEIVDAILTDGDQIEGLNTAASIRIVAGLDPACGAAYWPVSLIALALGTVVLVIGKKIVSRSRIVWGATMGSNRPPAHWPIRRDNGLPGLFRGRT